VSVNGRAIIVGAGIGGLTTAVALKRAGIESVVFERMPQLQQRGGGFTLAPNAVKALREIGVDEPVIERGALLEIFEHRTAKGSRLAKWPSGNVGKVVGAPMIGISRPALQEILVDALGDAADIRLGTACTGAEQSDSEVRVRLADGSEESGALLIGADGSRSAIRKLYDDSELEYSGYTTWLATADFEEFAPRTQMQTYGKGAILGNMPVGGGKVYWYAGKTAPPGGKDVDTKRDLMEIFGDWHEPLPALIEATEAEAISRSDIADLPRRETWGEGRVTLLGDAAHPMAPALGQGACQAIEDGVVLGRRLKDADDVVATLREYERDRIERTSEIVSRARMQGRMMQGDSPFMRAFRTGFFRFAPNRIVIGQMAKMLDFKEA
jgi:2-polyprenyl-6-methoxyphenol hydroxylase-like FAD-dependent oxidoreductase